MREGGHFNVRLVTVEGLAMISTDVNGCYLMQLDFKQFQKSRPAAGAFLTMVMGDFASCHCKTIRGHNTTSQEKPRAINKRTTNLTNPGGEPWRRMLAANSSELQRTPANSGELW